MFYDFLLLVCRLKSFFFFLFSPKKYALIFCRSCASFQIFIHALCSAVLVATMICDCWVKKNERSVVRCCLQPTGTNKPINMKINDWGWFASIASLYWAIRISITILSRMEAFLYSIHRTWHIALEWAHWNFPLNWILTYNRPSLILFHFFLLPLSLSI